MVLAGSALPEHTQVLPEGILIYLQQELRVRGKKVATAALQSIKYLVGRQFYLLAGLRRRRWIPAGSAGRRSTEVCSVCLSSSARL